MTTEQKQTWTKAIIAALLVPAILGAFAIVTMRSEVDHLRAESAQHVYRESVDIQYAALLRELRIINERLQRLEAK